MTAWWLTLQGIPIIQWWTASSGTAGSIQPEVARHTQWSYKITHVTHYIQSLITLCWGWPVFSEGTQNVCATDNIHQKPFLIKSYAWWCPNKNVPSHNWPCTVEVSDIHCGWYGKFQGNFIHRLNNNCNAPQPLNTAHESVCAKDLCCSLDYNLLVYT